MFCFLLQKGENKYFTDIGLKLKVAGLFIANL